MSTTSKDLFSSPPGLPKDIPEEQAVFFREWGLQFMLHTQSTPSGPSLFDGFRERLCLAYNELYPLPYKINETRSKHYQRVKARIDKNIKCGLRYGVAWQSWTKGPDGTSYFLHSRHYHAPTPATRPKPRPLTSHNRI
ncbi:hypothetical protein BDZ89DRAFT_1136930 [Hymenopellis radicata]|nr:hypothetical protein BDZ89DRAFT_1136930 [Hymenopellis radicata]